MSFIPDNDISDKILHISRKPAMLTALYVYRAGVISEIELLKQLRVKKNILYSAVEYIEPMKILKRYKAEDGNMYYTIHPNIIADKYGACEECKYGVEKLRRFAERKIVILECHFDKRCGQDCYRSAKFGLKVLKRLYGLKPASVQVLRVVDAQGPEREYETKHITEWHSKDFHLFINNLYRIRYPHTKKWTIRKISTAFGAIRSIFKHQFPDNWKMCLRRYIRWNFKIANNYMPDMGIMASEGSIKRFAAEDRVCKYALCKHYNIYCPYFTKGECGLDGGKKNCTDRIRDKMGTL
jgi:AraC-like DNA-binding protein